MNTDTLVILGFFAAGLWIAWIAYRDGKRTGQWQGWQMAHDKIGLQRNDLTMRHRQLLDDFGHAIAVLDAYSDLLHDDELDEIIDTGRRLIAEANAALIPDEPPLEP